MISLSANLLVKSAADGRTGCGARSKLLGPTLPNTSASGVVVNTFSADSEAALGPLIAPTLPIIVEDFIAVLTVALTPMLASCPTAIKSSADNTILKFLVGSNPAPATSPPKASSAPIVLPLKKPSSPTSSAKASNQTLNSCAVLVLAAVSISRLCFSVLAVIASIVPTTVTSLRNLSTVSRVRSNGVLLVYSSNLRSLSISLAIW